MRDENIRIRMYDTGDESDIGILDCAMEYHECSLLDFASDNRGDDEVLRQVEVLRSKVGAVVVTGGGAFQSFIIVRVGTT